MSTKTDHSRLVSFHFRHPGSTETEIELIVKIVVSDFKTLHLVVRHLKDLKQLHIWSDSQNSFSKSIFRNQPFEISFSKSVCEKPGEAPAEIRKSDKK